MCIRPLAFIKARISAVVLAFLFSIFSFALHAVNISGVVKDQLGNPIEGAKARMFQVLQDGRIEAGDLIKVGADGAYAWTVSPGNFILVSYFNTSDVSLVGAPDTFITTDDFVVITDTIRDSQFDFVVLSGKVVDSNNTPIANVDIETNIRWNSPEQGSLLTISQQRLTHHNGSVRTDIDGNYVMLLFSTDTCIASGFYPDSADCLYDITYTPPVASSFATSVRLDFAISSAQNLDQELMLVDQLNPKIIAGPYVKNITDHSVVIEWQTDEPVTSVVQIIGGDVYTNDQLKTQHSVVITDLDPGTNYSAQVNTTDEQNNSSTTANSAFTTASNADSLAPQLIQPLTITAISETQITMAFCANEAVSGKFVVDNVDYLLNELSSCHELTISNLNSNQSYAVSAQITDIAGNGPTASLVTSVKTLAAADLNPPLITAGPTITDISDSTAVVRWTTNEPASSGISFNNGTNYRVQNDTALVAEHSAQITGLAASTTYHLTVTSKDASGNRATQSQASQFVTRSAPDTAAPLLIGRALVEDISNTSAMISWQTDESSSTVIFVGTAGNNLNRVETSPGFSTSHLLTVTNLLPATTYYFAVESSDLAANKTTGSVTSFTTRTAESSSGLEIISQAVIERLTGNSITLSWRTNLYADSRLICESTNGTSEVNKIELSKNHIITLIGLEFNTGYRCVIYSTDISGQVASTMIGALTTGGVDSTPPQCVAPPTAEGFVNFAEISWQSDELATATVNYREKGSSQWSQQSHSTLTKTGFGLLNGLSADTDYEYQISLTDAVGNNADCALGEFNSGAQATTPDVPVPVFSIQPFVTDIGNFTATVNWSTERASLGQVRFGLTDSTMNDVESAPDFETSHAVVLNNLQAETTYFLQVDAFNSKGVMTSSDTVSFTTDPIPPVDLAPPKIISGPLVKNITDVSAVVEWETDKASSSSVVIAGGATFTLDPLTTSHSVLLTGLTADTDYATMVSSTDDNGLTSTPLPANFRTLALPDSTLPSFVSGPTISSIDYDKFTVSFCADEPVTAVITVDTTGTLLTTDFTLGSAAVCHQFVVTGLTPRTQYTVVVAITDIASNGPVTSEPLTVTTLFDLDILPPEITGPIVTDITQSTAIVRWSTNEASTSGVSYSDGSSDSSLEDEALVTTHTMYLSGLSASTTYTLTASSTDAAGNGPSISAPVEFTTLALPDTTAPQIIAGPFVENITTNSADILWTTNESASHLVLLGLADNALDQTFSLTGFDTEHRVPVTNLLAGTIYFFRVESADLAGNTVTSDVLSFKTLKPGTTPVTLSIIAGPDVENATTNSLTVSWQTNLDADSRLVCEAEQGSHSTSEANAFSAAGADASSGNEQLAPFYSVAPTQSIDDQYIVILKEQTDDEISSASKNKAKRYGLSKKRDGQSRKQFRAQRKAAVKALADEMSSKVKGKALRHYSNGVPGFVLKMKAAQLHTLRKDPRILMIEQDQVMQVTATQNSATWGLDRIDQADLPLNNDFNYALDGSGVNAYIIDTGILTSHSDFGGRAVSGWDYIDNDADASDCNGHGTHVAGTVGGTTWGVAKNVTLTAIRVLNCNGSGTSSGVIAGIDWVTANAKFPAVANMSLGGGNSAALDAAVDRAIDAGITFAVAAGNSNNNACSGSPNKVPAAITVASSTSADSRSSFSNWGSCIDLFAPGSGITSTWSNGGTNTISGTSMASPHVAGTIALYLQAHPDSTPAEVTASLKGYATADIISGLNGSPNLLLNVEFDGDTAPPVPPAEPPVEKNTFEISNPLRVKSHLLTLTGLDASTIYSCKVYSSDINGNQVSASLRGTTEGIPDTEAPECSEEPSVTGFVNSAQISWASNELTTAVVNYRQLDSADWLQNGTLDLATQDSLLLTGLLPETEYEQQVTLTDIAGNSTQCPAGYFNTVAPEAIPDCIFTLQPVISNITEHSATVSWSTLQPSTGNVRYGKVPTNMVDSRADNQNVTDHSLTLQNLDANTVYYLQVDAFNILGEKTTSAIVNFTTLHFDNDFDNDGILNGVDNCPLTPNPDQLDSDNDGAGDACDPPDVIDNDFDKDGILNDVDNCPVNANPDQLDTDNDGLGDACDTPLVPDNDFDNDGVLDDVDNCPLIPNADQADGDNDGVGDVCDAPEVSDDDYDDDGVLDDVDNCPLIPNADQADGDNDGIGDVCDTPIVVDNDFDNDGVLDDVDNCPLISNADQADRDNNGIGDACDVPEIITQPPVTPVGINLSGIISGEGVPVTGAEVAIYNSQKQFLDSVTTPADGAYLFENMLAGGYFIGVTPPADSGLSNPTLQPISVADRDVVHLITLIGDALTLSGYLKDSQGRVIDNIQVSLHQQTTGNQVGNSVRTNTLGYFEFSVAPGTYKLRPLVDVFNPATVNSETGPIIPAYPVPDYAAIFHGPQNIQLSADTTLDVTLPFALLSGQTLDNLGNPVAGVGLAIRHQFSTTEQDYYLDNYATDASSNAISDANGDFEFALFTDQAVDILLTPPANRIDLAVTTISDYSLSADASETFTLVEGVSLSGVLQDTQGRPIDNTKVSLHQQDSGDQVGQAVYTDANGLFQFQVETGSYKIKPQLNPFGRGEGQRPVYPLPDFATVLYAEEDVVVAGATLQDVVLPMAVLSGTTTDANGSPIADTRVTISHIAHKPNGNGDTGYYLESQGKSLVSLAKTDANGEFSLALFTDQATDINFVPPLSNNVVSATLISDYIITQDTTDTFVLTQPFILSGYLKDEQNNPIDNTMITVHNQSNRQLADAPVLTDANGYFEFKVAAGNYQLRPYLQPVNQVDGTDVSATYPVPDFAAVYYQPKNISVFANTSIDVTLPMSVLSGKAMDANGVIVPGVKLRIDHAYSENSISYYMENSGDGANSNAITASNGEFAFSLFTNQITDISVNPPALSGFAITNVSHTISQETSEDIWLIHSDFAVPKIIAGPFVKHITDTSAVVEWLSDKPGTSVVDLSNGRRYQTSPLTTHHSVVLTDLDAVTLYLADVHSVDKDGRASETLSANFTTLATPDYRAPLILEGPLASNITHEQFTLSLCADEPVAGFITVDSTLFALPTLALCHELLIDGLTPNTAYTVVAEVTDAQGNGPTVSQPLIVTTLPAPDVTPPVIQLIPMVIDISDTHATVIWTTDEASTSGVSYNDGSQYHVVSDDNYVKQHSMPLADLTPETTYNLTVSSTDRHGNGPTTSLPISFTTLATPDTTAPIIIGSPLIQNITHQSVVIRWDTSEPATTRLVMGTSVNAMDQIETKNGLNTFHNLPVTGLQPDTVYYFQVQTSDAEGNLAMSEIMSFRTKVRGHKGNPHFMSAVEIKKLTDSRLTVYWVTDVNADARLVCTSAAGTLEVSNAKRTKKHTLTLTGLQAATTYACTAFSTDHHGYTASQVIDGGVVTGANAAEADTTPPVTTATPVVESFGEITTLKLLTDELSVALLEYRLEGSNSWQAFGELEEKQSHLFLLHGLIPSSDYQLRYVLADVEGNQTQAQVINFNSGNLVNILVPDFAAQPTINTISTDSAEIQWANTHSAFGQVSFGRSVNNLLYKEANVDAVSNHKVILPNLDPATIYYAQVTAFNLQGETVSSEIVSFVTSAMSGNADSDADGLPDVWETHFELDPQNANDAIEDLDNDGLTNLEEYAAQTDLNIADSDNDGMPDGWEVDQGLDPNDPADADPDPDNDGLSNLEEYQAGGNIAIDDVPPELTIPSDMSVISTGPFTPVDLGVASALDFKDGNIVPSANDTGPFAPGRNLITWSAADQAGNIATAQQIVDVTPMVSFPLPQTVFEGESLIVEAALNGNAVTYPVTVPFTISGTAQQGDDHNASNGEIVIASGTSASIEIATELDGIWEGDETIIVTMGTPSNAASGAVTAHTATIKEENIAPTVSFMIKQNGETMTTVYADSGSVEISAIVVDPNPNDGHAFDWSASSSQLSSEEGLNSQTFTFNPADLSAGLYPIALRVEDDGEGLLSDIVTSVIKVASTAVVLSNDEDSDGDGIVDAEEGYGDSDMDRIPDYLDAIVEQHHLPSGTEGAVIQTESGLHIVLGETAFASGKASAAIDISNLEEHGGSGGGLANNVDDGHFQYLSGIFDFEISGINAGDSIRIVLPQASAILDGAIYRKYSSELGWSDFVEDANNLIASAEGLLGVCPAPGDASYLPGLNEGHFCVELTIEDGGANDADHEANGKIVDPGGVAVQIIPGPIVSASNNELGDTVFSSGDGELVVFSFNLTSDSTDAQVHELTINASGSINETTDIGNVSLYRDANNNGIPEASERIATGNYLSDNGELTFSLSQPYQLTIGDTNFLVTYQF